MSRPEQPGTPQGRLILTALCLAQFGVVLAFQGTSIVLPEVESSLDLSTSTTQWLVSANALAFGGLLLPAGRAADLYGHRRLFIIGCALFAIGSLAAGLAPGIGWLIAARVIQGAGTAMSSPAAFALLADTFPDGAPRQRALGAWGVAGPLGGIGAVVLGGVLATAFGWRAVFIVGAPVMIPALVLAKSVLPPSRRVPGYLDPIGAIAGAAGLGLVVAGLGIVAASGTVTTGSAGLLAAGAVLCAGFVISERRSPSPLVPRDLMRRPGLLRAVAVAFFQNGATNTPIVFYAQYMQLYRDASPLWIGIGFLPCNAALIAGSALGARAAGRFGFERTMVAGMIAIVTGAVAMTTISPGGAYITTLLPGLCLVGFGLGVAQIGVLGAAAAAAPATERGIAGGLVNAMAQIGTAVGLALLVAGSERMDGDIERLRAAFAGAGLLAAVGLAIALGLARPIARVVTGWRQSRAASQRGEPACD